jgi:hypothetical protein
MKSWLPRKETRKAKKMWRNSGFTVHRQIFVDAKNKVTALIAKAKLDYYKDRIDSSIDSQNTLFACVKELLNESRPAKLSSTKSDQEPANHIATFFKKKFIQMRSYLYVC